MIVVARLEITQMDEDGMLCSLLIILVTNLPSISIVCVSNIIPNLDSELLSNVS